MDEQKNDRYYELLEKVDVSEVQRNDQLHEYVKRYYKRKRNSLVVKLMSASVAAIIVLFIAVINLSPQMAYAMSQVSFFKPLVNLVMFDKGLADIIQNEYYEPLNMSQTIGDLTVNLNGIIADESGMMILYDVTSDKDLENFAELHPDILQENKPMSVSITSGSVPIQKDTYKFERQVEISSPTGINYIINDFTFILESSDMSNVKFEFPFSFKNEIAKSKVYDINQTLEIEKQKILVHSLKISPLVTQLTMSLDKTNTKQILHLVDIVLLNEKGEEWGKARGGVTQFGLISDDIFIMNFQSNYFRLPKSLILQLKTVDAVNVGEDYILVDFDKKDVVYQPSHLDIKIDVKDQYHIAYTFAPLEDKAMYSLFGDMITDNGKQFYNNSVTTSTSEVNGEYQLYVQQLYNVKPEDEPISNPVKIEIKRSTELLHGEARIMIKNLN